MSKYHTPVLLNEILGFLAVQKSKKYIDATIGGGGHAKAILEAGGIVLGIDADEDALDEVRKGLKSKINNSQLFLAYGNFSNIDEIAHLNRFNKVSGILFDLGVSSSQIDNPTRGFSFLKDGPLDMRMDSKLPITAEYLVNLLGKGELYEIFKNYGEETRAGVVSHAIASARRIKAIRTTDELVAVIGKAYKVEGELSDFTKSKISQKVFQALRIAVNNELEAIEIALPKALELLERKAKLVVISFHSLEDKIVKNMLRSFEKQNMGRIITKKPVVAGILEVQANSRSKSAKLRVFEKN